jgi:hypothetical protein
MAEYSSATTRPNGRAQLRQRVEEQYLWRAVQLHTLLGARRVRDLDRVREHIRFRLGLDQPNYAEPHQRPSGYFRGLTAKPWHDAEDFPWTKTLEGRFRAIRDELDTVRAQQTFRRQHQRLTTSGNWNVYYFSIYGRTIREHTRLCPETTQILESIPGATSAGLAYFSAMEAGTHVQPHCGPFNTRLRCHFGLSVPEGAELRVGSEVRPWIEGKCIVFDDSFEHEVWNRSSRARLVLIVDTWHPDLAAHEIDALNVIERLSSQTRRLRRMLRPVANPRATEW